MEPREPEWLTYAEVGERLSVSPHAARAKATRMGWRRQLGNDGKARVLVALEPRSPDESPMITRSSPARKAIDPALAASLESHIKTLQGEIDALREQLADERGRTALEAEKAGQAIAAFASLAERLDALAVERARPWWRRLRITG